MDNHYHLFIETPQPNLSLGMRQLNGRYTQAYNRRHTRVGEMSQFLTHLIGMRIHLGVLVRHLRSL